MGADQAHTGIHLEADQKQFRLSEFFDQNWAAYIQSPADYISPEQYKAVAAMRVCRTEFLGVDHYVCPDCGEITQGSSQLQKSLLSDL